MITTELLRRAVDLQFGAQVARSANIDAAIVEPIPSTGGGSFNTTVQRLSDATQSWSIIVKQITADPERQGWDREVEVYADAAWLAGHVPADLLIPRLLASHETHQSTTLVLQDLKTSRRLRPDDLVKAAELLTQFSRTDADRRPWWTDDFITHEFQTLANHPERLEHPRGNHQIEQLRRQLTALAAQGPDLVLSLQSVPTGPAHLDAYSRNLIAVDSPSKVGLIDWANAGSAPIGADPATIFILTLNYLDAEATSIIEFERAIVEAMHTGLDQANAGASATAATNGFRAVARLRHLAMMMNALPMVEAADPAVSAIVGRPLGDIIEQWLAVGDHLLSK